MAYIIRRLLLTLIVVFGVSIISFALTFLTGDPAVVMLGSGAELMTQAQINEFRHANGFDRPWYVQYVDFASKAIRGDFGKSLQYYQPAFNVVVDRFPATLELALLSLAMSVVFAVPSESFPPHVPIQSLIIFARSLDCWAVAAQFLARHFAYALIWRDTTLAPHLWPRRLAQSGPSFHHSGGFSTRAQYASLSILVARRDSCGLCSHAPRVFRKTP
jgi:hypothetical protein